MVRRLTDTYFVKCSFSICFGTHKQRLSSNQSIGVWVIPENEVITEYIQIAIERKVKDDKGDDYIIADFVITEIRPL